MSFFDLFASERRLLAAHRGARALRPENTLCALEAAAGRCDFIEFDVRLSRDSVPVVIHDKTLRRTTDVASIAHFADRAPWMVHEFTLGELQRLDYGSWFQAAAGRGRTGSSPGRYPQPLLTLEQALLFSRQRNIPVNIEIKDMSGTPLDGRVVPVVLDLVEALNCAQLVLVSAFRHAYLRQCARLAPAVSTALLQRGIPPDDALSRLRSLGVCACHTEDSATRPDMVEMLTGAGFHVNVYTVNDSQRREQLYGFGVTAVFSDHVRP